MFQVNIFPFWLCLFAVQHIIGSLDCDDLHDSLMKRDGQKTSKKSRNYFSAFRDIFPLSQQLYLWGLAMYHTTLLDVQEKNYHIAMRWSCLPAFVCWKSLWSLALFPERVDSNHKEIKRVSLMHEHGEICSLKSPWPFHLYSENSWWSIFNMKVVISIVF